ncbi:SPOR domain-containing protein [Streptomyces albus subsp. chlorinus]|uniref:SPOR domain-containing protein n=1 Tax=Streptomyces albus TaxID=1888 RepID=UPI00156EE183|nr:SPOR domain-containing protein [Streptomyces albus]NSC23680.1 SPOR domain-containing protein [Streptomyces albus subsp. chlorinus]
MRSTSGDSEAVRPWQLIRQDRHGNRYRVGSYATWAEAKHFAERLGERGEGYVVEHRDRLVVEPGEPVDEAHH